MKNKIDQIGKTFRNLFSNKSAITNSRLRKGCNAESVKESRTTKGIHPNPAENVNLRTLMIEAKTRNWPRKVTRNFARVTSYYAELRTASTDNKEEVKMSDETYVREFIEAGGIQTTCKVIVRIGNVDSTKRRPIELVMNSEEGKDKIMKNLKNLKDNNAFHGLSFTDDYTMIERQLIKEYADRGKEKIIVSRLTRNNHGRSEETQKTGYV